MGQSCRLLSLYEDQAARSRTLKSGHLRPEKPGEARRRGEAFSYLGKRQERRNTPTPKC